MQPEQINLLTLLDTVITELSKGFIACPTCSNQQEIKRLDCLHTLKKLKAQLEPLAKDSSRLDWLADPQNNIGNVQLPTQCVESNLGSLRNAIDTAMSL